jgi:hypothetical protein
MNDVEIIVLIDCEVCPVREIACGDCVVTVLLDTPRLRAVELDATEQVALARLADAGLVPHLQPTHRRRAGKLNQESA